MNGIFAQLPVNSVHMGRLVADGSAVSILDGRRMELANKTDFSGTRRLFSVCDVCVCVCNTTIVDRISSFQW